jgi:hypothetical protein
MTYEEDYSKTTTVKKPEKTAEAQVRSKVIVSTRKAPDKAVITTTQPLVLSFSEGALAGTIKFVKAGDVYQDNTGKQQRYNTSKIVIKTTVMKDPFTITEPLYRFMMAAFSDEDAMLKIQDWLTE